MDWQTLARQLFGPGHGILRDGDVLRGTVEFDGEPLTVIGTTDLDHRDDLDTEASITAQEVEYMLRGANAQFPQARKVCKGTHLELIQSRRLGASEAVGGDHLLVVTVRAVTVRALCMRMPGLPGGRRRGGHRPRRFDVRMLEAAGGRGRQREHRVRVAQQAAGLGER